MQWTGSTSTDNPQRGKVSDMWHINCLVSVMVQASPKGHMTWNIFWKKRSAAVMVGHRGEGGGTKPVDDEIRGPEYYVEHIQTIEPADVSMFQSAASVPFQWIVHLFTKMSVHVFFVTWDYVLVFYWDTENAEVVQMTRQLIMFWSFGKIKMLKRKGKGKKSQLTMLSTTEVGYLNLLIY